MCLEKRDKETKSGKRTRLFVSPLTPSPCRDVVPRLPPADLQGTVLIPFTSGRLGIRLLVDDALQEVPHARIDFLDFRLFPFTGRPELVEKRRHPRNDIRRPIAV